MSTTAPLTLRLMLDVTYSPNGVSKDVLREMLESIVSHATDNGLLTGETAAEVDDYVWSIVELRLSVGNDVFVTPNSQNLATNEFAGTIVKIRPNTDGTLIYTVLDMEGNCFDCDASELSRNE